MVHVWRLHVHMWRSEDDSRESVLSPLIGSSYQTNSSNFFLHGVISFVLIGLLVDSRANQFDNQGSPSQKEMRDGSSEPSVSDLSPGTQI